jgi:hypothetical protein
MKILTPIILITLLFLGCSEAPAPEPVEVTPTPESTPGCQLSKPECDYVAGALAYLSALREQSGKLVVALKGAATGDSTPDDIKAAIERAKRHEDDTYAFEYSKSPVPAGYEAIDAKIKELRQAQAATYAAYAEYPKTRNLGSISLGSEKHKEAIRLFGSATDELTRLIQEKEKALGK